MSNFFSLQLKPKRGFTLIELMIAISIIAILSAVGLVTYNSTRMIARDAKRKADLRAISQALELFYAEYKRYPCSGNASTNSAATSWLSDSNVANCVSSGVTGSGFSIAPTYMSSVPKDPLQTGSYYYTYYSTNLNGWASCTNQDAILWAQLENSNDPDRAALSPRVICGTLNINNSANFNANAYVIKMP